MFYLLITGLIIRFLVSIDLAFRVEVGLARLHIISFIVTKKKKKKKKNSIPRWKTSLTRSNMTLRNLNFMAKQWSSYFEIFFRKCRRLFYLLPFRREGRLPQVWVQETVFLVTWQDFAFLSLFFFFLPLISIMSYESRRLINQKKYIHILIKVKGIWGMTPRLISFKKMHF